MQGLRASMQHDASPPAQKSKRAQGSTRTASLRKLLASPGILQGPCCHDGLSARLIERAGFPFAFMSGFCTAGARLGLPDTGLISYAEMVDTGRAANEATRAIPIIGDGDTGYGNAMNVKRTVRGYAQAGFAGILIEDQVAPKSCGHVKGKRVTSREEAVSRIRAAVDAREEGADILVLARTDARQAVSMEEALWRVAAFADAGADILFIDALESEGEMRAFCRAGGAAARVPKMANMLEGGGKTPILTTAQLEDIGYKLVAYPLSLLGVSIRAMEGALAGLRDGRVPGPDTLGSFASIQDAVGFNEYYEEEGRYAIPSQTLWTPNATASAPPPSPSSPTSPSQSPPAPSTSAAASSASASTDASSSVQSGSSASSSSGPVVEADAVIEVASTTKLVPTATPRESGGSGGARQDVRPRFFLIKIINKTTGVVDLETRIPANFLSGLAAVVPAVGGINVEAMVASAMRERTGGDARTPLLDIDVGTGDKLQVFMEF